MYLKSVLYGKLSLGSLGGGLNFDGCVDLDLIRSVRHPERPISPGLSLRSTR